MRHCAIIVILLSFDYANKISHSTLCKPIKDMPAPRGCYIYGVDLRAALAELVILARNELTCTLSEYLPL